MLHDIRHHLPQSLPLMIAGAFIMHLAKRLLDGIGLRTLGRQIHQLDSRLPRKLLLDSSALALLSRANRQIRSRHWLTRRDTLVDRVKLGNRIRREF
jgi:hypothetical protein